MYSFRLAVLFYMAFRLKSKITEDGSPTVRTAAVEEISQTIINRGEYL